MAAPDPHSFADNAQPRTKHIDLDLSVDFTTKTLTGIASLELERAADDSLDLDTRALAIHAVADEQGRPLKFVLYPADPIKGARLRIEARGARGITVHYQTSDNATALQWLDAEQTAGKRHPYVYTQCQAIHARSIVPCQDSPRVRVTSRTKLHVPRGLAAVMAARFVNHTEETDDRVTFTFEMPQPIPSYLLAFAVGNIEGRDLSSCSRIYAEPEILESAAWEFAEVPRMIRAAEDLFGPYAWERFDLLVMPPSFPYGGMENPRLTFLTPTLLAGDRSLVNVVAHELAHSWTGNLVTNASLDHFWLNEGFTVFAERRILEVLEGPEELGLHAALGRRALDRDMERLGSRPEITRLRNHLLDSDPDEVFSAIPYEKGYLFLRRIEDAVGRDSFDAFLREYIDRFRFQSITTDDFERFLKSTLGEAIRSVDLSVWLDGVGVPADAPCATSTRLTHIEGLARSTDEGGHPPIDDLRSFDATDWQVYLAALPKRLDLRTLALLDGAFNLTRAGNAEIRVAWLTIAATSSYEPAMSAIRTTLCGWGRMKYLRPLYSALIAEGPRGCALARDIYTEARAGYHPIARALVEGLLARLPAER